MNDFEQGMNCEWFWKFIGVGGRAAGRKRNETNDFRMLLILKFALAKFRVNVCTTYHANNNTRENHETPAFFGRCLGSRLRFLLFSLDILDFCFHIGLALLPLSSSQLSVW